MKWSPNGVLSPSKTGGAQFGAAISVSGDLALIGAPGESGGGAVYMFKRGRDGSWTVDGTLPAQGLVAGDQFGAAIAIDGARIAVGAPARKTKGAVFSFRRDSTNTWVQETEQVAGNTLPDNSQFGASVAVKGDRIIVGAPNANMITTARRMRRAMICCSVSRTRRARRATPSSSSSICSPLRRAEAPSTSAASKSSCRRSRATASSRSLSARRSDRGAASERSRLRLRSVQFGSSLGVVGDELWIGAPGSDGSGRIYRAKTDREGSWTAMTKLGVDTVETGALWSASFAVMATMPSSACRATVAVVARSHSSAARRRRIGA
jgi:hypothetical protein